jgi:serine/threonine protein kinase
LCPGCALLGVAEFTNPEQVAAANGPTTEEIAAAFPELEVLEIIGQGGMGVVFKARQPRLDRLVALKILPPALAVQPGFSERFTREARVLAKLAHPHIVTVYDFGESAGFFYLIMEFVNGVNLRAAMQSGVTPEQALLLVPPICQALQFAHDHGVLHRDIKPENILLDTNGSPKLADFGIAKLAGEEAMKSGLTATGATLGTAAYMAPEQIERPAAVDHRADIYSLGVVLYEMLTGELPLGRFSAPSEKAAVDRGVDEVVLRALEKERERRQQSATEMKSEVEGARAHTATPSPRRVASSYTSTPEPVRDPWPRRIFILIMVIVVLPVVLIAIGLIVPIVSRQSAAEAARHNAVLKAKQVAIERSKDSPTDADERALAQARESLENLRKRGADSLALAEAKLAYAEEFARVTRVRKEAGVATSAELEEAVEALATARRELEKVRPTNPAR